jgi:hypothetical protein
MPRSDTFRPCKHEPADVTTVSSWSSLDMRVCDSSGTVGEVETGVRILKRFIRWGSLHGPAWGGLAMLLAHLLPEGAGRTGHGLLLDVGAGVVVGIFAGPVVGFVVGLGCVVADRLPRWLLDAPDYVAVATVFGVATVIELEVGTVRGLAALLMVGCVALPAAVDAALVAPALLHPSDAPPPRAVYRPGIRLSSLLRLLPHR